MCSEQTELHGFEKNTNILGRTVKKTIPLNGTSQMVHVERGSTIRSAGGVLFDRKPRVKQGEIRHMAQ